MLVRNHLYLEQQERRNDELYLWFCYVNLLVFNYSKKISQWESFYCSIPAYSYDELKGFGNNFFRVVTVLDWHPLNRCAIAEVDGFEYPGRCPDTSGKPY